jgi:hypothetical protein
MVIDSRVGRLLVACREIVGADLEEAAIEGPAAAEDWAEIMPERMNRLISPTDWKKLYRHRLRRRDQNRFKKR